MMKRVGGRGLLLVACAHAHAPRWPCRAGAERFEASTCRRAPPAMKETTLDRLTGPKLFKTVKRHVVPLVPLRPKRERKLVSSSPAIAPPPPPPCSAMCEVPPPTTPPVGEQRAAR